MKTSPLRFGPEWYELGRIFQGAIMGLHRCDKEHFVFYSVCVIQFIVALIKNQGLFSYDNNRVVVTHIEGTYRWS